MHKGSLQAVCTGIIVLLFTSLAQAQIHGLTVAVEGMSCPFCAFGVEKKLQQVEGVESITIDMKKGTASLKAKKGQSIGITQVQEAVKSSGFSPGKIMITAAGMLKLDDKQRPLFHPGGAAQSFLLTDLKDALREKTLSLAQSGKSAEIQGAVRKKDGTWALIPESLKEVPE